jgi:catechol 2,3-dioxygenase-like lactoylglutathione lyase family enzyme
MHATGITANLSVDDLAEAREFYVGFLGLSVEGFNLGWVVNLHSPDGRAVVQLAHVRLSARPFRAENGLWPSGDAVVPMVL